jgi:hypothetical protein
VGDVGACCGEAGEEEMTVSHGVGIDEACTI